MAIDLLRKDQQEESPANTGTGPPRQLVYEYRELQSQRCDIITELTLRFCLDQLS